MSTMRWSDSKTTKLEDAINLLVDSVDDDNENNLIVWKDWQLNTVFPSPQITTINGLSVDFNVIRYSYNQVTLLPYQSEDRIIPKSGRIIVYSHLGRIKYIIDQNSNSQKC